MRGRNVARRRYGVILQPNVKRMLKERKRKPIEFFDTSAQQRGEFYKETREEMKWLNEETPRTGNRNQMIPLFHHILR